MTGFRIFRKFQIWQDPKYVRVTYGSEQNAPLYIFDNLLNMPLVLKWQGYREFELFENYSRDLLYSEYFSGSNYSRVLNIPGLHKVMKKTQHYRYLILS